MSIPQVIHQENLHFCDKSIGIVAPVYGHEVPGMVKEFLHKATFDTDYFYMILTYGNRHGGAAELAAQMENLDSYDIIFLGYPNWNADLPMPLYTLLEQTDLSGKTIVPFTTHGGSGFSRTIQTIQELQPNATVISDGLSISRNSVTPRWATASPANSRAARTNSSGRRIPLMAPSPAPGGAPLPPPASARPLSGPPDSAARCTSRRPAPPPRTPPRSAG